MNLTQASRQIAAAARPPISGRRAITLTAGSGVGSRASGDGSAIDFSAIYLGGLLHLTVAEIYI